MAVLELENVTYRYPGTSKQVLSDVSYQFEQGNVYAVVGRSGSGKTTMLSLLAGLATPTSGKIVYSGKNVTEINRYDYRSQNVGVIFQSYNLLPHLTVLENIMLSMDASGKKFDRPKKEIARELLEKVDLNPEYANQKILHLSGGEQQRVAIARTLSFNPDVILADEPTGNLDIDTEEDIISIFQKLAHDDGKCVILVTHSPEVAKLSDVIYQLASTSRDKSRDKFKDGTRK